MIRARPQSCLRASAPSALVAIVLLTFQALPGQVSESVIQRSALFAGGIVVTAAVDSTGAIVVVSKVSQLATPLSPTATVGPLGSSDIVVAKLNADLTEFVYLLRIGSSASDTPRAVSVDSDGAVYVGGSTRGPDFPTTLGSFQEKTDSLPTSFIFKLESDGDVAYSSFLSQRVADVAVDLDGRVWVVGATVSLNTTEDAFQPEFGAGFCRTVSNPLLNPSSCPDGYFLRVSAAGDAIEYASYLGGTGSDLGSTFDSFVTEGSDEAAAVAIGPDGSVFVAGITQSRDFPTNTGSGAAAMDVAATFVARFTSNGQLIYSTVLESEEDRAVRSLAVDSVARAYVLQEQRRAIFRNKGDLVERIDPAVVSILSNDGASRLFEWETPHAAGFALLPDGQIVISHGQDPTLGDPVACFRNQVLTRFDLGGEPDASVRFVKTSSPLQITGPIVVAGPDGKLIVAGRGGTTFGGLPGGPTDLVLDSGETGVVVAEILLDGSSGGEFGCVVNAASQLLNRSRPSVLNRGANLIQIAPNEILTISGRGLGPLQGIAGKKGMSGGYPLELAGAQVTFDGQAAQLLWAQDRQINLIAPDSLSSGSPVSLLVAIDGQLLGAVHVEIVPAQPGVFTDNMDGTGQIVAFNADSSRNSYRNPAELESIVTIFATGLASTRTLQVTIGLEPAEVVDIEHGTGVSRIALRVPAAARPGDWLIVESGNVKSQGWAGVSVMPAAQ